MRHPQTARAVVLIVLLVLLTVIAQGCGPSGSSVWGTWRGKTIEVRGAEGVSLNGGDAQVEVVVGNHRILVTETAITLDGATKDVASFTRVVIEVKPAAVSVIVDGKPLFP